MVYSAATPIEPLLDADAVAAWLGCSSDTVLRYAREAGLPFIRLNSRRVRFRRGTVQAWLDSKSTTILPVRLAEAAEAAPAAALAPPTADWKRKMDDVVKGLKGRGAGAG